MHTVITIIKSTALYKNSCSNLKTTVIKPYRKLQIACRLMEKIAKQRQISVAAQPNFPVANQGGPAPYFRQSQFNFFTLYTMSEKMSLKLNLDFIVAEIRGVSGSVGVYACVCESKS